MAARGRISSMCRSKRRHAAIEMARHPAAIRVVRCAAVISSNLGLNSTKSFQVPALEDQERTAQRHSRIAQRLERVLQDKLRSQRLLMRDRAYHIERGEVRHQIGRARDDPSGAAVSQGSESAKVVGEAADNE